MTDEEIAVKLQDHENRIVGVEHRTKDLEEFQKAQNNLVFSVNKLALNMENMVAEIREQGNRLGKLEKEPAERWNSMQKTAFTTIVSTVAGALAVGLIAMIANYL